MDDGVRLEKNCLEKLVRANLHTKVESWLKLDFVITGGKQSERERERGREGGREGG